MITRFSRHCKKKKEREKCINGRHGWGMKLPQAFSFFLSFNLHSTHTASNRSERQEHTAVGEISVFLPGGGAVVLKSYQGNAKSSASDFNPPRRAVKPTPTTRWRWRCLSLIEPVSRVCGCVRVHALMIIQVVLRGAVKLQAVS